MKIRSEILKIQGAPLEGENPLPLFRATDTPGGLAFDHTFLPEDTIRFGEETDFRVLPYRMQDRYSRNRRPLELDVLVLENEFLKALFLPGYGGRLISLFDKEQGKELLFRNPVFQPANLAIRNAWFSGGVEWNIGWFGHTVFTCAPLFFARLTDDEGNEFLRAWEYERMNRLFFSMDFHLPRGERQLGVHVRIINDNPGEEPLYWWTNTAVREEDSLRIFSGTDQVLYIKPESNARENSVHEFGRAGLGALPSLPGKDPSYPENFTFSSEYFFQTPLEDTAPWEAAVYGDGSGFFERSTPTLRYRKMFCWGRHPGGRHWCDYLSEPSRGDYVEIQAGLAPSQVHGLVISGGSEVRFSQFFGSLQADPRRNGGPWDTARDHVLGRIDEALPSGELERRHDRFSSLAERAPEEILHSGSGWGALEGRRRRAVGDPLPLPAGLSFPDDTLGAEQEPWLSLVETGVMTCPPGEECAASWMVDPAWESLVRQAAGKEKRNPWPLIHLGVLLHENRRSEEALEVWQRSLSLKATPLAWRNIAMVLKAWGDEDQALNALRRAAALEGSAPGEPLSRELIQALNSRGRHEEAWKYYSCLPREIKEQEKLAVAAAGAALARGDEEYLEEVFRRPLAYVKEGETLLVDYWYLLQARRLARERGIEVDEALKEEVRRTCPPPESIDFMMA